MVPYFVKVFELYPPKSAWGGCVLWWGQRRLWGGQGCHSLPLQGARWKAEGWVGWGNLPHEGWWQPALGRLTLRWRCRQVGETVKWKDSESCEWHVRVDGEEKNDNQCPWFLTLLSSEPKQGWSHYTGKLGFPGFRPVLTGPTPGFILCAAAWGFLIQ